MGVSLKVSLIRHSNSGFTYLEMSKGVNIVTVCKAGIGMADKTDLKTYAHVLTANDVFVFGYPSSIGLKNIPQIDYDRPLLIKGIVAGKNAKANTIVLQGFVYPGNSGGPVLQVQH